MDLTLALSALIMRNDIHFLCKQGRCNDYNENIMCHCTKLSHLGSQMSEDLFTQHKN